MAPKPPDVRRAPAEPWRASVLRDGDGAPKWPQGPPTFVAPRRSRDAPLCCETEMGAPRNGPQAARRSSRGGGAVALLCVARRRWGPEMAPKPPDVRRAAAEPWRASVLRDGDGAPKWPPGPATFGAPRRSRGAALCTVDQITRRPWMTRIRTTTRAISSRRWM